MDSLTVLARAAAELDIRASARVLGSWSLKNEKELVKLLRRDERRRQINAFRADAVNEEQALVAAVADGTAPMRDYLHAVNKYLVLVVELCVGDPFPYAIRDIGSPRPALTPFIATALAETVLAGTTFGLYARAPERPLHVVLDYRHRTAIDRHTWTAPTDETAELPTWGPVAMATVNPYASFKDVSWKNSSTDWFCVKPKEFDKDGVLRQLE